MDRWMDALCIAFLVKYTNMEYLVNMQFLVLLTGPAVLLDGDVFVTRPSRM